MTDSIANKAVAFSLSVVQLAADIEADYNVIFNGLVLAQLGCIVAYLADKGVELTPANVLAEVEKLYDLIDSAANHVLIDAAEQSALESTTKGETPT